MMYKLYRKIPHYHHNEIAFVVDSLSVMEAFRRTWKKEVAQRGSENWTLD